MLFSCLLLSYWFSLPFIFIQSLFVFWFSFVLIFLYFEYFVITPSYPQFHCFWFSVPLHTCLHSIYHSYSHSLISSPTIVKLPGFLSHWSDTCRYNLMVSQSFHAHCFLFIVLLSFFLQHHYFFSNPQKCIYFLPHKFRVHT